VKRAVRERAISGVGGPVESTRRKLLDATRLGLARFGTRKLAMTDVADLAGVSRPTLYRYFPSKEALLAALAEDETQRFDEGLTAALRELSPGRRLDTAVQYMVDSLADDHVQRLVGTEPAFVLERFAQILPAYRARLATLVAEGSTGDGRGRPSRVVSERVAEVAVRLAMSYFLFPEPNRKRISDALRSVVLQPTGTKAERSHHRMLAVVRESASTAALGAGSSSPATR
jgi:AcrR family transcriptional regulator